MPTRKQSLIRWLLGDLISDFSSTQDWGTVHEYLQMLQGFDRKAVLQGLFGYALD